MEQSVLELIFTDGNIYNTAFNSFIGMALGSAVLFILKRDRAYIQKVLDEKDSRIKELEEWRLNHAYDFAEFKGRTETHQHYSRPKPTD